MAIESDRAEVLSGVRAGETIGGPIAMLIENKDWPNWQHTMRVEAEAAADAGGARRGPVTRPRPGHADLAGVAKFGRADVRDVLERASARETAARVAAGAVAKQLLARTGVRMASHVFAIGAAQLPVGTIVPFDRAAAVVGLVDLVHACADASANPSYTGDNLFVDTEPIRRLSRELRERVIHKYRNVIPFPGA